MDVMSLQVDLTALGANGKLDVSRWGLAEMAGMVQASNCDKKEWYDLLF
jgi:hypothetical protein